LPDFDHKNSTAAHSLGPVTRLLSGAVSLVSFGHRKATHSLLAVFGAFVGVQWLVNNHYTMALLALICFTVALFIRTCLPGFSDTVNSKINANATKKRGAALSLGAIVPAFLLTTYLMYASTSLFWVAYPVALGVLIHILGDALTPQGVPLLWPLPMRFRIPLFRTNSPIERIIQVGCMAAVVWLGVVAVF